MRSPDDPPFDRLTDRQRDCLRELALLKSIKEIGLSLGIAESTINGHLEAATRNLGMASRAQAALAFQAFERKTDPQIPPGPVSRVEPYPAPAAKTAMPQTTGSLRLPLRRQGAARNDLSPLERLAWIPVLAIAFAIGFGMLSAGLHFVTGAVRFVFR